MELLGEESRSEVKKDEVKEDERRDIERAKNVTEEMDLTRLPRSVRN